MMTMVLQSKWSNFATSFENGPVDGIGGAAKRFVQDAVREAKCIFKNAATFANGTSKMPKIRVRRDDTNQIKKFNIENTEQIKDIAHTFLSGCEW